jgi:hypothetical protein
VDETPRNARSSSPVDRLRRYVRRRRQAELEFRQRVRAQNVHDVNELAGLSDAELIATKPGTGNVTHEMEMTRRLKAAIAD